MPPSLVRRWAPDALVGPLAGPLAGLLAGLLAVLLPLGPAAPAQATPGCKQESQVPACADTEPPDTQISGGPHDEITPGQPVSLSPRPSVVLTASEPATFNCAINSKRVPCQAGETVLKNLSPGTQVFVAQAVDQAGNFDASPASLTFYVPHDLSPRKGAVLTVGAVKGVREVRLIAPVGPKLGKVAIRVGQGSWIKVRLKSAEADRLHVFVLRGTGAKPLSGVMQVKALKVPKGGAVAVDAIVAR
jgi:hypothetical protein